MPVYARHALAAFAIVFISVAVTGYMAMALVYGAFAGLLLGVPSFILNARRRP
jgi:hypothetical protein